MKFRKARLVTFLGCVLAVVAIAWGAFSTFAKVEDIMVGALVIVTLAVLQIGQVLGGLENEIAELRTIVKIKTGAGV